MDKPSDSITKAREGYWNSRAVSTLNPGGFGRSDDGLKRGWVTNFPEAVVAIGDMTQWVGGQAGTVMAAQSVVLFTWDANTSAADPGTGNVRASTATPAAGSFSLFASLTDTMGNSAAAQLASLGASTSTIKARGRLSVIGDPQRYVDVEVMSVALGGYATVAVNSLGGPGGFAAGEALALGWTRTGDTVRWRSGAGAPDNGTWNDGDYYLNTVTGAIYVKAAGAWVATGLVIKGTNGSNGTNGATWYSGAGVPASGLGAGGDFYFRTDNGAVYTKAAGAWSTAANLTGPAGPTLSVQKDGAAVATRSALNFVTGANTSLAVVDNPAQSRVDVTVAVTSVGFSFSGVRHKAASYAVQADAPLTSDAGCLIDVSSVSATTQTLPAPATAGNGFTVAFYNSGAGATVLSGAINGSTSYTLLSRQWAIVTCDGAAYRALGTGAPATASVWNPADKSANCVLSNGGLTMVSNAAGAHGARGTQAIPANAKVYNEYKLDVISGSLRAGLCNAAVNMANDANGTAGSWNWYILSGFIKWGHNSVFGDSGVSAAANGIIMEAYNTGTGCYWLGYNGTWFAGGDPVTGANPIFASLAGTLFPFGQVSVVGEQLSWKPSSGLWVYSAPTGFSAPP